jgi:hypothetical protein
MGYFVFWHREHWQFLRIVTVPNHVCWGATRGPHSPSSQEINQLRRPKRTKDWRASLSIEKGRYRRRPATGRAATTRIQNNRAGHVRIFTQMLHTAQATTTHQISDTKKRISPVMLGAAKSNLLKKLVNMYYLHLDFGAEAAEAVPRSADWERGDPVTGQNATIQGERRK